MRNRRSLLTFLVLVLSLQAFAQGPQLAMSESEMLADLWARTESVLVAPSDDVVERGHRLLDKLRDIKFRPRGSISQTFDRIRAKILARLLMDPRASNFMDDETRLNPQTAVRVLWLIQSLGGFEDILLEGPDAEYSWQVSRRWFVNLMVQAMEVSRQQVHRPLSSGTVRILTSVLDSSTQTNRPHRSSPSELIRWRAIQAFWSLRTADPSPEALTQPNKNTIWKGRLSSIPAAAGLGELLIDTAQALASATSRWDGFTPDEATRVSVIEDLVAIATQVLEVNDPQRPDLITESLRSLCRVGVRENTRALFGKIVDLTLEELRRAQAEEGPLPASSIESLRNLLGETRALVQVANGANLLNTVSSLLFRQSPSVQYLPMLIADLKARLNQAEVPSADQIREFEELVKFSSQDPSDDKLEAVVRSLTELFEISKKFPAFARSTESLQALLIVYQDHSGLPNNLREQIGAAIFDYTYPNEVRAAGHADSAGACVDPFSLEGLRRQLGL
jgi:hypothetical protein